MSFNLISVNFNNAILIEIDEENIGSFFKAERNIFSKNLSALPSQITKKIEGLIGRTDGLGYVGMVQVVGLVLKKNRPDVFNFIEELKTKYSCLYLVGK